jgi:hypothetical protein
MNLLAFLVLSLIVFGGIWIADNLSSREKEQNCGRISKTNCAMIPGSSAT